MKFAGGCSCHHFLQHFDIANGRKFTLYHFLLGANHSCKGGGEVKGPHVTTVRQRHTYTQWTLLSHGNHCLTLISVRMENTFKTFNLYMHTPSVRCRNDIDPIHIQTRNITSQCCVKSCLEHNESQLSPLQCEQEFVPGVLIGF